jgi:flagellar motor protein MotB
MSRRFIALCGLAAAFALAGCSTTNWEEVANERDRALHDQNARMDAMTLDTANAVTEAESAKTAKAAAERDAELAKQQAREAAERAIQWQNEAERMRREGGRSGAASAPDASTSDDAVQRTVADLRSQGYRPEITADGNIEIPLESDVTFGSWKTALTDSGKKSLRGLAPILNGKFAPYMIRVEGHTDSQPLVKVKPIHTDNFGLGSARSLEVVRFMTSDMKIDAKRLMSASRGEQEPKVKGSKPTDLAKNRRVEIVVVIPRESAIAEAK